MPLPPGLILNPATGELSGVPTVAGTYAIQLKVRDVLGSERDIVDEVIINAYTPMTWSGDLGVMMATRPMTNNTVALDGGLAAYVFTIFSGILPPGLVLDPDTGVISGTPEDPGGYAFTLRVTDALNQVVDYVLAGTIVENLVATITAENRGTVGVAFSAEVEHTGGTGPFDYSIGDGTLPLGLSFADALITGSPTAPSSAAVVLRVTDANGFEADTDSFQFDVQPFPTLIGGLERGMVGKAYVSTGIGASGGHLPYSFSATNMPPGLLFADPSDPGVDGTPTLAGTYSTVIRLQDDMGNVVTLLSPVEIAAALDISGTYATDVTRNIAYPTFNPIVVGGFLPRAFDISAGALPTGLNLNATTGAISGTPTTQGAYTATLRVTDADGSTDTMAFDVDVAGDMAITGDVPDKGTLTVAFSGDNLGRTGGTAPFTWSVSSGALPPGLTLNTSTGDITGTPTVAGTYNFSIRVTDASAGFAEDSFSIVVVAYPSLSGTLPDASNGLAYDEGFAAAGGHLPLVWDISAGALPTGLSIDANDGSITGTPSANGAFSFTVRITDDEGNIATRPATVTVYAAPSLSTTQTSPTEEGQGYSDGLTLTGGKAPVTWSVQGALPPGLSINAGTGVISGTVSDTAVVSAPNDVFSFTVRVQDALGRVATSAQSIDVKKRVAHVAGVPPPAYLTRTIASSTVIDAQYGLAPYTFSLIAGAVPTGMSLAANGDLTGTPSANGTFNFTVRIVDDLGMHIDGAYTINVVSPVAIAGTPGEGTVGVAYAFQPTVSGGITPYSWFHVAGDLPPGCTLNTSTGRVSGTPTTAGTWNYTLRVYSGGSLSSDDHATSTTIYAAPTFSTNYGRGTVAEAYSGTISTAGGKTPKTYARISGAFPPGVALNASTGALSGTPTATGTYAGTVRMTDALGNIRDDTFSIGVTGALAIPSSYPAATDGVAYDSTVTASGGYAPYSWSLVSGAIPTGLSRSGGRIFGTPTTPGTYNFTLRITDADSHTFDKAFQIVVGVSGFNAVASPNPASDYAFTGGFNVTVSAASTASPSGGGIAPFTYAWTLIAATGSAGNFATVVSPANKLTCSRTGNTNYLRTETWRCRITDNAGTIRDVNVVFELEIEADTGGGSGCPDVDCVLPDGRRVGDLKVGDLVECVNVVTGERFLRDIRNIRFSMQPCMQLRMAGGGTITQSESTRMVLRDGSEVTTPEMMLQDVLNYNGEFEQVLGLKQVGVRMCANVDLGNVMFFCGDADGMMFATHNAKMP